MLHKYCTLSSFCGTVYISVPSSLSLLNFRTIPRPRTSIHSNLVFSRVPTRQQPPPQTNRLPFPPDKYDPSIMYLLTRHGSKHSLSVHKKYLDVGQDKRAIHRRETRTQGFNPQTTVRSRTPGVQGRETCPPFHRRTK